MKGDINLLPIKKNVITKELLTLIIVISALIIVCVGYFFVFIPNSQKASVLRDIDDKENELKFYQDIEMEYSRLITEQVELQELLASMDVVGNAEVLLSDILYNIDAAVPVGVMLSDMEYKEGVMVFLGRTRGMVRISQFLVKLRQMENVSQVNLQSISYVSPDELHSSKEQDMADPDDKPEEKSHEFEELPYYDFEISILYDFNQLPLAEVKGDE